VWDHKYRTSETATAVRSAGTNSLLFFSFRILHIRFSRVMTSTLKTLQTRHSSRVLAEKRLLDKRRELMLLTHSFLIDQGLVEVAAHLAEDAALSTSKFEVADNIDLPIVFQHFLEYYEMRFGHSPKILRKISSGSATKQASTLKSQKSRTVSKSKEEERDGGDEEQSEESFEITGTKLSALSNQTFEEDAGKRLLKPLSNFLCGASNETKELALTISRDIFTENPNVKWDDVVGLGEAKRVLNEAVVMPLKHPEIFRGGLVSPWKGVLLFGPPGTGKTMIAKALATECRTTFFNISASSIVSKYRGDSEKLVRILFDLARFHAPSTIFLDEIDSIMGQRGSGSSSSEHEASRRMKTELLIQMDGLARANEGSDERIFVLAASNIPWELDNALLRRLEKRVLIDLPASKNRKGIFRKLLPPEDNRCDKAIDYDSLAEKSENYSCADIALVCKEAAMHPIRRAIGCLQSATDLSSLGPVKNEDVHAALARTKPSMVKEAVMTYKTWLGRHGSN